MNRVNFCEPTILGTEKHFVNEAIANGMLSGNGEFTKKCENFLEKELQIPRVLLLSSCTHALEMSALLLDISEGDEVILPSFTFVSTANAFLLRGASLVFCDIRPDTLNIDETALPRLITNNTKAIVVVHYAGVSCNMQKIVDIAKHNELVVIEDNAHGLFGQHSKRYLGTFGCLATHSFHGTKNITCGEGGALFINDESLIERAQIIREKGTNRQAYVNGKVDKYTWVDIGSSYLMSEICAAFLFGQLTEWKRILSYREQLWNLYALELHEWATINKISMPVQNSSSTHHIFQLIMPSQNHRKEFMQFLSSNGIQSAFHYQPLHLSQMGIKFKPYGASLPVTERVSNCLVRLPLHHSMTVNDILYVSTIVKKYESNK